METQFYIQSALKNPDFETACLWFINEYPDSENHPWKKYLEKLFLNFKIITPDLSEDIHREFLLSLVIIFFDCDLIQTKKPRHYRLLIDNKVLFDKIEDVDEFITLLFGRAIGTNYIAHQKNDLAGLEEAMLEKINIWNDYNRIVKQEQILYLSQKFTLIETAEKVNLSLEGTLSAIKDNVGDCDRIILNNLKLFMLKKEQLIRENPNASEGIKYFNFIVEQVRNGGEDINEIQDLLPQYSGMIYN